MYYVPQKLFKCGPDVAIPATRVIAIMATTCHQARETMKSEKRAGTLINASGRDKTQSVIFLDNGSVIASPYSVSSLLGSIEKAVAREPGSRRTKPNSNVIHAFDAVQPIENETDITEEAQDDA